MSESKKEKIKVTTGRNANMFYDPTTGLKVVSGDVVEIGLKVRRSPLVKKALNNGHLIEVKTEAEVMGDKNPTQPSIMDRWEEALIKESTFNQILEAFTSKEIQHIAKELEVDLGGSTTKPDMLEKIKESYNPNPVEETEEELVSRFDEAIAVEGVTIEQLAKDFNLDQLKVIAINYEVEIDEEDTAEDILNVLLEEDEDEEE